jgi:hypothetical protein
MEQLRLQDPLIPIAFPLLPPPPHLLPLLHRRAIKTW